MGRTTSMRAHLKCEDHGCAVVGPDQQQVALVDKRQVICRDCTFEHTTVRELAMPCSSIGIQSSESTRRLMPQNRQMHMAFQLC